jgi:hypothetical protein
MFASRKLRPLVLPVSQQCTQQSLIYPNIKQTAKRNNTDSKYQMFLLTCKVGTVPAAAMLPLLTYTHIRYSLLVMTLSDFQSLVVVVVVVVSLFLIQMVLCCT